MTLIATCAHSTGARLQFDHRLQCSETLRYTPPVTSKKGVIGIGLPLNRCDESRSICSAELAASLSVPQFMVARMGERKLRRFAQAVPGSPTHSSYRPGLDSGSVVFANRTAWRPFMADFQRTGRCAQIIPLPSAQTRPVVQTRSGSGRYPGMVTQLWRVRAKRQRLEYLSSVKAEKIANLQSFGSAE